MKIPWVAKSVFGVVATTPSGPPSVMVTWPTSMFARLPSFTAPGTVALADVTAEQVAPIAVLAVAEHAAPTGNGMSTATDVEELAPRS